jgi:hypothetical protein
VLVDKLAQIRTIGKGSNHGFHPSHEQGLDPQEAADLAKQLLRFGRPSLIPQREDVGAMEIGKDAGVNIFIEESPPDCEIISGSEQNFIHRSVKGHVILEPSAQPATDSLQRLEHLDRMTETNDEPRVGKQREITPEPGPLDRHLVVLRNNKTT